MFCVLLDVYIFSLPLGRFKTYTLTGLGPIMATSVSSICQNLAKLYSSWFKCLFFLVQLYFMPRTQLKIMDKNTLLKPIFWLKPSVVKSPLKFQHLFFCDRWSPLVPSKLNSCDDLPLLFLLLESLRVINLLESNRKFALNLFYQIYFWLVIFLL